MTSGVVQFREDGALLAYLRKRGLNPNEFAREALERAYRRLRMEEANRRLEKFAFRLPKSAAELVREDRDSH
jgi:hypothetical protein